MNIGDIRRTLRAVFVDICGVGPSFAATDRPITDEEQSFFYPDSDTRAKLNYKIISISNNGIDELRMSYDPSLVIPGDTSGPSGAPATGGYTPALCGNRKLTVSVKVECHDLTDDRTAIFFAEACRSQLMRPSILARLRAVGVSIATIGDLSDGTFTFQERRVSQARFDLFLNAASNITDDVVTTIQHVIF